MKNHLETGREEEIVLVSMNSTKREEGGMGVRRVNR